MPSTNELTNPFENSILNMNLVQLKKDMQLANYSDTISQGYEPPTGVLAEMVAIPTSDDLSTETQTHLQSDNWALQVTVAVNV